MRRLLLRAISGGLAVLAVGCGSASVDELPPAAEPARSPALTHSPAGRVVDVGARPEGIAVDPRTRRVAVTLAGPGELALLDAGRASVVGRVRLPESPRLVVAAGDGTILVAGGRDGRLTRVRALDGRVVEEIPVGTSPHEVATGAGGRIFVTDARAGELTVLQRGRRVGRVPVAAEPGGVAVLDGGRRIAVVSRRERVVELFDTRTLRRVARFPAGVGPTQLVAEPRDQRLYVVDTDGGGLLVFRTRPELELVRRVYMPGRPYGIAIDNETRRLWVTATEDNEVAELPAHGRPHVLRRLPTVRQPDRLAVDEESSRVVIAGAHDGVVQIIEP